MASVSLPYSSTLLLSEGGYTLSRNVPAIQVQPGLPGGGSRLGLITQLPAGAQLEVGGAGFDDQTVRVRCGSSYYYVFLDDLEPQRKRVAAAIA